MNKGRPRAWTAGRIALALTLTSGVGCGFPELTPPVARPGALDTPFAVSNFFTPSGYMGDGAKNGNLKVDVLNRECKPRPPGAVGDCYRFVYHPSDKAWAGVYWAYPANNWGSRVGRSVVGARFKEVRVQIASDTPDVVINLFMGGIKDFSLPHRDEVASRDTVRIGQEWQTVRLNLGGQEFDHVIGAFGWSLGYPKDWDGQKPVVIYLDDIVWDTESTGLPTP